MKAIIVVLAILLAIGLAIGLAVSTGDGPASVETPVPTSDPPAYLAGTTSRLVTSVITGRTYQVSVALPRTYDTSDETYPTLYMVDANAEFGTVVETARLLIASERLRLERIIPELIVVGIGYPLETFVEADASTVVRRPMFGPGRWVDMTPTPAREWNEARAARNPRVAERLSSLKLGESFGGGPGFLQFMRDELIPNVEAEYRADPGDRAFFGHSLGGDFAFYSLLEGEGTFHRFIVGSASLTWDDGFYFDLEERFAETHSSLPVRAFFAVGSLESENRLTTLPRMMALLDEREYDGFEFAFRIFEDETHTSVVPVTISRGLRYIYGDQQ